MKKIVITAGGTSEKIDNVRKITNSSSGKLGMTIANHLLNQSEDLIIYMYEEWFEKLAKKVKVEKVKQTKNSIEMIFPMDVVKNFDTEVIFMDAFYISNMFRFISKGEKLVIVLDIIKLEKHPVYYLVELLEKISTKFCNSID